MKKVLVIFFATLLLFSQPSYAECSLGAITQTLSESQLNASFIQSKKITALNKPLESLGKIWLSPQSALVWQVNKPIKSTMVIKAGQIIQYNRKEQRLDSNKMATPDGVAELFFAIANGTLTDLSEQFKISLQCDEDAWQMQLEPKEVELSQLITQLTIVGSKKIDAFSYLESRGDFTSVTLTHLQSSLAAELARYVD